MTRGTTPLHKFVFPNNVDEYSEILITYRQNNRIVLEKQLSDLDIVDNIALLRLTQEETFSFDVGKLFVQLKVLTVDGRVLPSAVYSIPVLSSLSHKVLGVESEVESNEDDGM